MAPRGIISATTLLLCLMLGPIGPTPAALGSHTSRDCCTRYNRKPVPFQLIKGYREQITTEHCRIDAIIFYTIKRKEICATRMDEWVRRILELLSSKLKKMSKKVRAVHGKKRNGNFSINDGRGSFSSTTETVLNSTGRFY